MKCKNLSSAQRVDELEEALKKKDDEMKQMEERYKKYLEKAKSVSEIVGSVGTICPSWLPCVNGLWTCSFQVIRTLDPKQNQGSGPEVQALKNQLQEKERMLHSLEVQLQKEKVVTGDAFIHFFRGFVT